MTAFALIVGSTDVVDAGWVHGLELVAVPVVLLAVLAMRRTLAPDDMLAVVPLTCPECATRGTLVLAYGPEAAVEDSEVLAALPEVGATRSDDRAGS